MLLKIPKSNRLLVLRLHVPRRFSQAPYITNHRLDSFFIQDPRGQIFFADRIMRTQMVRIIRENRLVAKMVSAAERNIWGKENAQ